MQQFAVCLPVSRIILCNSLIRMIQQYPAFKHAIFIQSHERLQGRIKLVFWKKTFTILFLRLQ